MRQTLMLATMAVMTACGVSGNTPWDQNHDGLVTACEGLNPQACDATAGCERAAFACTLECRDDGHGGCVPCDSTDVCRPSPPSTGPDCSQLPINLCGLLPMCEVVQRQLCTGAASTSSNSGAGFAEPSAAPPEEQDRVACQTITACVNRLPEQCESLSVDLCLAHPGCALEGSVSTSSGSSDPAEGAPALCDLACDANGVCSPCGIPQPQQRCVTLPPPDLCGGRDANTCTLDGQCMLESAPLCDVACDFDGNCPPCTSPSPRCVAVPPTDDCAARDANSCEVDGRCVVEAWACAAICQDDGHGGCVPCDVPPPSCVPAPAPSPTPAPSRCEGLDQNTCVAAGCVLTQLDCSTECRDDGQGGCLPCAAYTCTETPLVDGGGTPPPAP